MIPRDYCLSESFMSILELTRKPISITRLITDHLVWQKCILYSEVRKCTSGVLHWNILKAMFKYGYTWIGFCTRELKTVILPSIFFRAVWQASSLANSNGLLHVRTLSHSHLPSIMLQPVTKFSLHGSNPKSWSSSQFSSEQGSKGKKYLSS